MLKIKKSQALFVILSFTYNFCYVVYSKLSHSKVSLCYESSSKRHMLLHRDTQIPCKCPSDASCLLDFLLITGLAVGFLIHDVVLV